MSRAKPAVQIPVSLVPAASAGVVDRFARTGQATPPERAGDTSQGYRFVKRKDGREGHRTTIMFSPQMTKRVRLFAADQGRQLSEIAETAIGFYLDSLGVPP